MRLALPSELLFLVRVLWYCCMLLYSFRLDTEFVCLRGQWALLIKSLATNSVFRCPIYEWSYFISKNYDLYGYPTNAYFLLLHISSLSFFTFISSYFSFLFSDLYKSPCSLINLVIITSFFFFKSLILFEFSWIYDNKSPRV